MRSLGQFIRKSRSSARTYLYRKRPKKFLESPAFDALSSVRQKFPHQPSYVNGDVKIAQCVAIKRDMAKTHGLGARSVEEVVKLKDLEQWAEELSVNLAMASDSASRDLLNNYTKNIGRMLEPWAEYLKQRQWVFGARFTYVDFLLYEALNWHHEYRPDVFLNYPVLTEYLQPFREVPFRGKPATRELRNHKQIDEHQNGNASKCN